MTLIITTRTVSTDYFDYLWKTICSDSYDCDYLYTYVNKVITNSNQDNNNINDAENESTVIPTDNKPEADVPKPKTKRPVRDIEYTSLEILDDSFLDYLDCPPELQPVIFF